MALLTTASTPLSTMLRPPSSSPAGHDGGNGFYANVTTAIVGALNSSVGDVVLGRDAGGLAFGASVTVGEEVGSNSTTPRLPHPQYYDPLYQSVAVTLSALVFTVGFVGNVLVVIVIARTRSMHTTTNCYLLSLAVADCLVLLAATLPAVPETFFRIDEWPFGRALCSILIYAQYVGIDASSLSITAFTIERYIAICHPIRAQTMCTVSRAKKIIGCLWIFTVLYCGPWLGLTHLSVTLLSDGSRITKCLFRLERSSYLTLYMFDLVVFYVLPFLISTVLYCLIGRILVLTSLRHARDRPARTRLDRRSTEKKQRQQPKRGSDSRVQVIRMLVVVVVVFATLWMPYRVMVVYNSFAEHKFMDLWFLMFSRTLIYINCAINPILYNVMSVKFRRAFKNLLCCAYCSGNGTQRSDRCAPKRPFGAATNTTSRKGEGLRPAGPPVYLYSEAGTEGSNIKRHTFNNRQPSNSSPPIKEMSPFLCRTHLTAPRQQQGHSQGQGRPNHPLKVILLEWVKGSDKVKVQTSNQPCYGSRHQREGGWPSRLIDRQEARGGVVYLTADKSPKLDSPDKEAEEPLVNTNDVTARASASASDSDNSIVAETVC